MGLVGIWVVELERRWDLVGFGSYTGEKNGICWDLGGGIGEKNGICWDLDHKLGRKVGFRSWNWGEKWDLLGYELNWG